MSFDGNRKIAIVTGASSGIGAASAIRLAGAGFQLALGGRRVDKLQEVANHIQQETGAAPLSLELDVTSVVSCEDFVQQVLDHYGGIHILVNNAGLAKGTTYVADAEDDEDWRIMMETNVMGLLRMSRLVTKHILASGGGHIINLGSIAGREAYAGGAGYCGSKFAVRAITEAMRQELLGKPVRITEIDPGMVETEFSIVRYRGDVSRANEVYQGMTPLYADDIADCVVFAATRKPHVNIDAIILKPLDQAGAGKVARRG